MDRFATIVERRLGLTFGSADRGRLTQVLNQRLLSRGSRNLLGYLDNLDSDTPELNALATALTVGETYFLRQPEQFRVLTRTVLPERQGRADRPASQPLRLLSAGCASGEEPYSLAITLAENGHPGAQITAIDVNPAALAKARAGRYTSWSMRAVSPLVQRRWFSRDSEAFVVEPRLRDAVKFRQHNLVDPGPDFWKPGFDVIFCRNVLMYFAPTVMAEAVRRLAAALLPGGYLFLGSAETLRGISDDFLLCETDGTFYYRLQPSARPDSPAVPAQRRPTAGDSESFTQVLDLIRSERFADALGVLRLMDVPLSPPRTPWETEVVLVRAVLLAHSGDLSGAGRDAHRLLGRGGGVAADAHAVLATCRETDSDGRAALLHWRAAVDADPRFAIGHLQLGRLSRNNGDLRGAGRSYDRAAELLTAESDRRVLLFGGGFDRDALLSVCRSMSRGSR